MQPPLGKRQPAQGLEKQALRRNAVDRRPVRMLPAARLDREKVLIFLLEAAAAVGLAVADRSCLGQFSPHALKIVSESAGSPLQPCVVTGVKSKDKRRIVMASETG